MGYQSAPAQGTQDELAKAANIRKLACPPRAAFHENKAVRIPDVGCPVPEGCELSAVQYALQEVIVRHGIAANEEPCREVQTEWFTQGNPPMDGLKIYAAHPYRARHLDCLRRCYRILEEILGSDFDSTAQEYFARHLPGKPSLREFVEGFARYLVKSSRWRMIRAELIAEVATFEIAHQDRPREAWPGGLRGHCPRDLRTAPLEFVEQLRVQTPPSLQLLSLEHACYLPSFCERAGIKVGWTGPAGKHLALYHRDFQVCALLLEATQYRMLHMLAGGQSIGQVLDDLETLRANGLENAQDWLCTWTGLEVCAVTVTNVAPRQSSPAERARP